MLCHMEDTQVGEMGYRDVKGSKEQSHFFLVCSGKGKIHIPGRTRDKLLGKSGPVFGVLSVAFPLQLILCSYWNVSPAFPVLTKK